MFNKFCVVGLLLWIAIFRLSYCSPYYRLDRLEGYRNRTRHIISGRATHRECTRQDEWRCKSLEECIPQERKCDGKADCGDGSDEDIVACANNHFVYRRSTSTYGICEIPSGSLETVYATDESEEWSSVSAGSKVPKFSRIFVTCDRGYVLPDGETTQESFCFRDGKWLPYLKPCQKMCPSLHSTNVDLSCYLEGRKVDCNGDHVYSTEVRPRCKPLFHREKSENYRELICGENGQWDNELFKCVPDCGIPLSTMDPLIFGGSRTWPSDSPWNVAVYHIKKNYTLICGGTLISTKMVLSAAHCFFDRVRGKASNQTTDYEIVVGKYTRDYNNEDTNYQKKYEISDIIFTDTGYNPTLTGQYGHDIIVIVLKESVELSEFVLPACIDWSAPSTVGFKVREGTLGKLAGWGEDSVADQGNAVLLSAELPFISYQKCLGKLNRIAYDNFCAGSPTGEFSIVDMDDVLERSFLTEDGGPGPRKGDSGGGLTFLDPHKNLYFLRGIVSSKDRGSSSSVASFTDVARHLDWLNAVRNEVEEEVIRAEAICISYNTERISWTCKQISECEEASEIINTDQEYPCGSNKYIPKICCPEKINVEPAAETNAPDQNDSSESTVSESATAESDASVEPTAVKSDTSTDSDTPQADAAEPTTASEATASESDTVIEADSSESHSVQSNADEATASESDTVIDSGSSEPQSSADETNVSEPPPAEAADEFSESSSSATTENVQDTHVDEEVSADEQQLEDATEDDEPRN